MASVKIFPSSTTRIAYEAIAAELQLAKDEISKLRSSSKYLSSQLLSLALYKIENQRLIVENRELRGDPLGNPHTLRQYENSSTFNGRTTLTELTNPALGNMDSATLPKDADVLLLLFCELMRSRKLGKF